MPVAGVLSDAITSGINRRRADRHRRAQQCEHSESAPGPANRAAVPLKMHDRDGNVRLRTTLIVVTTPIVITGLGVVSPFGDAADAFRDALLEGRTAIAP